MTAEKLDSGKLLHGCGRRCGNATAGRFRGQENGGLVQAAAWEHFT